MTEKKTKFKSIISIIIMCILMPTVAISGILVFGSKRHLWISICGVIIAIAVFVFSFENKQTDIKKTVLISVLTAVSVLSRYAFAVLPSFKPLTAIIIITGIYLGKEAGFLCGSLSAFVSNFIFGQGPWTPFQMVAWGIIGLCAALFSKILKKNIVLVIIYGALSGVFFSLFMDIWTAMWLDGHFVLSRYIAAIIASVPTMLIYAVSNAVFLAVLSYPMGYMLNRVITKYGIIKK